MGVVAVGILAVVLMVRGMVRVFEPSAPHISRRVITTGEPVYVVLGVSLLLSGIAELIDRMRERRRPSCVR